MDSTSTVHSESNGTSTAQAVPRQNGRSASSALRWLYEPIEGPLAKVEARFASELDSPYEAVAPVLRHGTQLGGKRLRPALLLLSGKAVGAIRPDHVVLGAVIEMVHTATLIHDDVLDQADTRRHVPTVNARWNEHTSILLGDYLFAKSFRLAATLPSTEACRWIGEAAGLVCEGELRQILDRNTIELDEPTYIDIIRGKTAELCRVACQLGAKASGADRDVVQSLGDYGEALGIAFQIADDYLDLWGEGRAVGKTLGTDIEQGKMTLPLIRLLQTCETAERRNIVEILHGPPADRLKLIRPLLECSDAADYTLQVARSYRDKAVASLSAVGASRSRDCLKAIANFSIRRSF
ncbi:MAG: polyprenyl synthetase family protein [Planctomycetota bacterium]